MTQLLWELIKMEARYWYFNVVYFFLDLWDTTLDLIEDTFNDVFDWLTTDTGLDYLTSFCFLIGLIFLVTAVVSGWVWLIPSLAWFLIGGVSLASLLSEPVR